MNVVYKYALTHEITAIPLPVNAAILSAQYQGDTYYIWVQLDPNAATVKRKFQIIGTGQPFDETARTHIATFHRPPFVWHIYEVKD